MIPARFVDGVLENWPETAGLDVAAFHRGHINDTYLVGAEQFVLQCVNRYVFPNAEGVMRNLEKIAECNEYVISPIITVSGKAWAIDVEGDLWRLFPYAVGSRNFQRLPSELAEPAGFAFGNFLGGLVGFDEELEVAIEGFHDLRRYLETFWSIAPECAPEVEFVRKHKIFDFIPSASVIHGDCKINNLLFHSIEPRAMYVIDLDTIMVGHPAWDFGDLVRSIASGGEEALSFDISIQVFEAAANGFVRGLGGIADPEVFAAAPAHMSFMLGVRFLTDHFGGDRYFKVGYSGQNLDRARTQFEISRRFVALESDFERVLKRL
jgi:hypothetical protein